MANEVPVLLKLTAEKTASVNQVLDETQKGFQNIAGGIAELGRNATAVSGVATAALGAMLGGALRVAGEFEQLQAKLTAVLGDATRAHAAFDNAVKAAATSPFDVKSMVTATVTLEAFGQSSTRLLPLVANLAAAMGKRVEDVGQIIGKAFSGNLEGLESLRNTLNVSNRDLAKFGAVLTKTGSISVSSSVDLEKFQKALEALVKTKFGTATEEQSKTLFGALSNLADAGQRLAASFGKELIPLFTSLARAITSFAEGFEKLPEGLRSAIAIGAVLGTTFLGVSTVILGLGTAFVSAAGYAVTFAAALGGIGATAGGLAAAGAAAGAAAPALAGAAGTASAAAAGFAALGGVLADVSALGGFLLTAFGALVGSVGSLALVGVAAAVAIRNMEQDAIRTAQGVKQMSTAMVESRQNFRDFADSVEKATGVTPGFVAGAKNSADLMVKLAAAMKNVPALELSKNLTAMGLGFDELSKKIDLTATKLEGQRAILSALAAVLRQLEGGEGATAEQQSTVDAILGKDAAGKVDDVAAAVKTYLVAFKNTSEAQQGQKKLQDSLRDTANTLTQATKSAQQFRQYLQIAGDAANIETLTDLIGQAKDRLGSVSADYAKVSGQAATQANLRKSLLSTDANEVALATQIIGLQKDELALEKDKAAQVKAGIKAKIDAVEEANRHEEAIGKQNLALERDRLKELLKDATIQGGERVKIEEEVHKKETEIFKKRVEAAKTSFENITDGNKDSLEKLRGTGEATAAQVVNALEGVIARTKAWGQANEALINKAPELRKAFTSTLQGLQKELDGARRGVGTEKVDAAFSQSKELFTGATTAAEKLQATEAALDKLRALQATGQITALTDKKRLQDEITRLTADEAKLQKDVTKEVQDQTRQTNQVKRQGLETNLEILKAQQQVEGKDNRAKIRQVEQEILAGKIQAIQEEAAKELEAAAGNAEAIEQINKRTELKITEVKNQEILKRLDAQRQFTADVQKLEDSLLGRLDQARQNRIGGALSPIINPEEDAIKAQLSSRAGFRERSIFGPGSGNTNSAFSVPSSVSQIQGAVDRDLAAGQSQIAKSQSGATAAAPTQVNHNTTVYVNANKTGNPDIKAGVKQVVKGIQQEQQAKRLTTGPASPRGVNPHEVGHSV